MSILLGQDTVTRTQALVAFLVGLPIALSVRRFAS